MTYRGKQWLWFGLFLRFLIMPFTGHPDMPVNFAYTFPLLNDGVFDIYSYLAERMGGPEYMFYNYGPMLYFLLGLWSGLAQWLAGPEYAGWMPRVIDLVVGHLSSAVLFSLPGAAIKLKTVFLWKSLYLTADLAALFFILKCVDNEKERESYVALWAGSAVILYVAYLFGQTDILPVAFIAAGIYLHRRGVPVKWTGLLFSLSVGFKFFSVLLLPFPFLLAKDGKQKMETAVYILLPLLVLFLPLYIHSHGLIFWMFTNGYVSFASQGPSWEWVLKANKLVQAAGYLALCYHALTTRRENPKDLSRYVFVTLLLVLCVPLKIHFYLWITPFWLFFLAEKKAYPRIYAAIVLLLFFALVSNQQSFLGLFAPLEPDFFMSFPGWMDITYFFIGSGIHVKLAILAIFFLSLTVVSDQLLTLYGKKTVFTETQATPFFPITRSAKFVYLYPLAFVLLPVILISVAQTPLLAQLKPYLFLRGDSQYYQPVLTNYRLTPGKSLTQRMPLNGARIKKATLFFTPPLPAQALRFELFAGMNDPAYKFYAQELPVSANGRIELRPGPALIEDKTLYLKITNTSAVDASIPIRELDKHFVNEYILAAAGESGVEEEVIAGGVLPVEIYGDPAFLYDPGALLSSLAHSLSQEKGFLALWAVIVSFCFAKFRQYVREQAGKN